MKKYGIDDKSLAKTAKPAAPAAPTMEGGGITGALQKGRDFIEDWDPLSMKNYGGRIAEGESKALGGLALGVGRLAGKAIPAIDKAMDESPTAQRLQSYVNEPSSGFAETGGRLATDAATMMVGGPLRWGKAAVDILPTMGKVASKWVGRAGNVAESGARGALAGAVANPEDQATGAEVGAAGSALGPGVGGALRSQLGRWTGRYGLPEAAFWAAHKATGMPFYPILGPMMVWHYSPVGLKLRRVGEKIVDQTGRLIGSIVQPQDWSRNMGAARRMAQRGMPGPYSRVPPVGSYTGAVTPQMGGYAASSAVAPEKGEEYHLPSMPWNAEPGIMPENPATEEGGPPKSLYDLEGK